MNPHLHTERHNHIVLEFHISDHLNAMRHREDPYNPQGYYWVCKGGEAPAIRQLEKINDLVVILK